MNTTINKAIVSIIGGILTLLGEFGIDPNIPDGLVSAAGTMLTAVFVYLVPNKKPEEPPATTMSPWPIGILAGLLFFLGACSSLEDLTPDEQALVEQEIAFAVGEIQEVTDGAVSLGPKGRRNLRIACSVTRTGAILTGNVAVLEPISTACDFADLFDDTKVP